MSTPRQPDRGSGRGSRSEDVAQAVSCPAEDGELSDLLEFALTYTGYDSLANDPVHLGQVVRAVLDAVEMRGVTPEWRDLTCCGARWSSCNAGLIKAWLDGSAADDK